MSQLFKVAIMQEIWKDIPEYDGMYQVSSFGRVKSFKGKNCRLLKQSKTTTGYLKVNLSKNNIKVNHKIHQLVAICFLNHKPNGYESVVDHIDNNPLNNRLNNLQVISPRENSSRKIRGNSKYIGVYWNNSNNRYVSRILINKKRVCLGSFKCEYSAHLAYQKALKQLL